jgi:hypothetical protein
MGAAFWVVLAGLEVKPDRKLSSNCSHTKNATNNPTSKPATIQIKPGEVCPGLRGVRVFLRVGLGLAAFFAFVFLGGRGGALRVAPEERFDFLAKSRMEYEKPYGAMGCIVGNGVWVVKIAIALALAA